MLINVAIQQKKMWNKKARNVVAGFFFEEISKLKNLQEKENEDIKTDKLVKKTVYKKKKFYKKKFFKKPKSSPLLVKKG